MVQKTYIVLLLFFLMFSCNKSQKRDGILPKDKISMFGSKNRDLNSIDEDNKKDDHVYPILDVELKQVIDTPKENDSNYDEEGSGDFEIFENSSGNDGDEFYLHQSDHFSGMEPAENGIFFTIRILIDNIH